MKIYVVEDEPGLLHTINNYLSDATLAFTKVQLLISVNEFVCVIIDRIDDKGIDLAEIIQKKYPNAGITVIKVQNTTDKIAELYLDAANNITKPFHPEKLNLRILSVKRRNREQPNIICFNEVSAVTDTQIVFVYDKEVRLTSNEYKLLHYFLLNKNRILSKDVICKHLSGENINSYHSIYAHIKNLRKKLIYAGAKDYIKNLYNIGYKLSDSSIY